MPERTLTWRAVVSALKAEWNDVHEWRFNKGSKFTENFMSDPIGTMIENPIRTAAQASGLVVTAFLIAACGPDQAPTPVFVATPTVQPVSPEAIPTIIAPSTNTPTAEAKPSSTAESGIQLLGARIPDIGSGSLEGQEMTDVSQAFLPTKIPGSLLREAPFAVANPESRSGNYFSVNGKKYYAPGYLDSLTVGAGQQVLDYKPEYSLPGSGVVVYSDGITHWLYDGLTEVQEGFDYFVAKLKTGELKMVRLNQATGEYGFADLLTPIAIAEKPTLDQFMNTHIGSLTLAPLNNESFMSTVAEGSLISPEIDQKWVEMGYLPDLRNGGEITSVSKEINGETREFLAWRVGFTEIWVDKEFVDNQYRFEADTTVKKPGESIVLDPAAINIAERYGAAVHAINLGILKRGDPVYNPEWFSRFLQTLSQPGIYDYDLSLTHKSKTKPGSFDIETKTANGTIPVRYVLLPPRLTKAQIGKVDPPFGLDYRTNLSHAGLQVDKNGGIWLYESYTYNENGEIVGTWFDYAPIHMIFNQTVLASMPNNQRAAILGDATPDPSNYNVYDALEIELLDNLTEKPYLKFGIPDLKN